ncbi:MAG: peptidylprolyl isomerase [candidate division Zixibacteria bacterium]|nr:peptidylprolyl isomerase [candidate division Zixibacteria bacterium]
MCLLAGLVACSSSEADSTKVDKQWNDPVLDSLAQIRHDIRNKDNKLVTLETNYGKMTLELFHDVAPAHADSFVARAVDGFYDSTIFHRVVQNFMIQGGDPTGTGTGDAGYNLPAEFSDLQHVDGTLSMARGRSENSASCQFFICLGRNRSTEYLDGKYTVFGQLIKGYDVLHAIGDVKVGPQPHGEKSKPLAKVALFKAYVSDRDGNAL